LTNFTPQSMRDNLASLDSATNRLKAVVASVPANIPSIDWDSYVKAGVPAEQVASIRKTYEAKTYPDSKEVDTKAVETFASAYAARLAPEVANSANYMKDMQALKTKLQEDFITMHKWEPEDWARRFPGLVDKIRQRVIVGDVIETDDTAAYLKMDLKQITADIKAGKPVDLQLPAEIQEYYFGGINLGNDFPNTDPAYFKTDAADADDHSPPLEKANKKYIKQYGDLWAALLPKI